MTGRRAVADDRVADDRGKVALERGPIVYAAAPDGATLTAEHRPDLLNGVTVLARRRAGAGAFPDLLDSRRARVACPGVR